MTNGKSFTAIPTIVTFQVTRGREKTMKFPRERAQKHRQAEPPENQIADFNPHAFLSPEPPRSL